MVLCKLNRDWEKVPYLPAVDQLMDVERGAAVGTLGPLLSQPSPTEGGGGGVSWKVRALLWLHFIKQQQYQNSGAD